MSHDKQVALVTGGNRGIGNELVKLSCIYSRKGHDYQKDDRAYFMWTYLWNKTLKEFGYYILKISMIHFL